MVGAISCVVMNSLMNSMMFFCFWVRPFMDEFPPVVVWSGVHKLRIPLAAEFSTPFFDYYNYPRSFFPASFPARHTLFPGKSRKNAAWSNLLVKFRDGNETVRIRLKNAGKRFPRALDKPARACYNN
jgi:hypothetical protein